MKEKNLKENNVNVETTQINQTEQSTIANKNKKIITVEICVIIIILLFVCIGLLYKFFYDNNIHKKAVDTVSTADKSVSDIVVKVDDEQEEIFEELDEQIEEKTEEELKAEQEQKELEEKLKKEEEEKKKKAEEEKYNSVQGYKYYIKVNYTANTVTVYTTDSNGKYTVPVKAMVCSTGAATPTSGVYKTQNKYRWRLLIGNSYGQYSTRITGQILFHSVPYERQSEDSLITKYYDRLGITTSLGCIRLTVADAKWIYDNCPLGTSVEFYSSSNPGPLGKPSAKKIADYGSPLNRWDPTDPNPNNPWKNQNDNTTSDTNNNTNNNVNNNTNNDSNTNTNTNSDSSANTNNNTNTNTNTNNNNDNTTSEPENNKKITITNVVGKTENEARKALENLTIKTEYKSDSTKDNGIVLSQSLKAGSEVDKGTTITLTVNKIEEMKQGTVNINVKSLTGYSQQKDEDGEVIQPKKVSVRVTVDDKDVYKQTVSEDTENVNVTIKGKNTVTVKVYIDEVLKQSMQMDLNGTNTTLNVK